jgi:hypothetical protein
MHELRENILNASQFGDIRIEKARVNQIKQVKAFSTKDLSTFTAISHWQKILLKGPSHMECR